MRAEDPKTHRDRYRVFIEDVADGFYETNLRGDFTFFNDALCRIFGYSREEIQDRNFRKFMGKKNAELAYESVNSVYRTGKSITNIVWRIIHKDGETRVLEISSNPIFDKSGKIEGFRGIARDVTREKRADRTNRALFRIALALYRFRGLDERLEYIVKEVRDLIGLEGASIILIDDQENEFFFRAAGYDNTEIREKIKEVRFPLDKGVAGKVYRTGRPVIVPDTSKSPDFFNQVDVQSNYQTRNMIDVPISTYDRMIGILCAVNKKEGEFDQTDLELMSTIANTVAFPIENASINEALRRSYEEVESLNRAKDKVIHHLSHELKTPVSILSASLSLLNAKFSAYKDGSLKRIMERAQRNLNRILEMQYEIEDILREGKYQTYYLLSPLLDACVDELEVLFESEVWKTGKDIKGLADTGIDRILGKIRQKVEELFGPRESVPELIEPNKFVETWLNSLQPRFAHRTCRLITRFEPSSSIWIPPDVLKKVIEGLIRNAVENTPDNGRIEVTVREGKKGPEFEVKDYGVGITPEKQRLIFENNFITYEIMQYSTRNPYDFNAGGKGFDLLRMKIFSERYNFKIRMSSKRCGYIPRDEDICPGKIELCKQCRREKDCPHSGGTTITVQFLPADQYALDRTADKKTEDIMDKKDDNRQQKSKKTSKKIRYARTLLPGD
ncbi:MAG: PAS domain S-box protein [Desulfobacterales bacterium]|jgi:PAS domain S-box-containing protein|nr:histidine kinase [Desulfobacter sp.]MDP6394555.1 PAS domain S-box protein [Desulfobacterales bacterium]MDP6683758.1 PAS domain S-box protein [Desulfobacterales bacterium]MDP6806147.1 PAS domain S-box protein [Desulfobacterales bacterium]|tara:strand:+ start:36000 stop:38021 length:2022 start_codon:yes stop_codon:yes gene_type:complete